MIPIGAAFVGDSAVARKIRAWATTVASSELNVLIMGETGVGKEILAQLVHLASSRAKQDFVVVNCPAITPDLAEAELFGHEKGAFTGATKANSGLLQEADGGTVFFDEVGDADFRVQLKLLRFLGGGDHRQREIRRVGTAKNSIVNVRVIAASNQDLENPRTFRRDLYHRLKVFTILIPPLRERKEDIPALARHFIGLGIAPKAFRLLEEYSWPGNVRELKNVLEPAAVFARASGRVEILPQDITLPLSGFASDIKVEDGLSIPPGFNLIKELAKHEQRYYDFALKKANGNQTQAAELLDIARTTLAYRQRRCRLLIELRSPNVRVKAAAAS